MAEVKVLSLILILVFPWSCSCYILPSANETNVLGNNVNLNILRSDPLLELRNHIVMNTEGVLKLLEIINDSILHYDIEENKRINEEMSMNSTDMLTAYGFHYDVYEVHTKDGYILLLIRVYKDKVGNGEVVVLYHGMFQSSDDWLTLGRDKSIVTKLVNNGSDVWLCNFRGNVYSRKHADLKPENPKFWDFSWHDMGIHDAPAIINFILTKTGKCKLIIISQSQGATLSFVMLSEVPEMNDKVKLLFSLATPVFMSNLRSRIVQFCGLIWKLLENLFKLLNVYEFLPRRDLKKSPSICGSSPIASWLCLTGLFHIFGFDYPQIDKNVQVQLSHAPAGSSIKQSIHYLQLVQSEKFRYYDYGETGNMERYNNTTPPSYRLENISTTIVLFHGKNDMLSSPKDIAKLSSRCPSIIDVKIVDSAEFQHQDFVWAKNAPEVVYDSILELIHEHGLNDCTDVKNNIIN